jgi:hypothetical protein
LGLRALEEDEVLPCERLLKIVEEKGYKRPTLKQWNSSSWWHCHTKKICDVRRRYMLLFCDVILATDRNLTTALMLLMTSSSCSIVKE